jgi:hypothetical protein
MVKSRGQNAGQSHNIKTENTFFERVEQFTCSGAILMNQNSLQQEIKSRQVREYLQSFGAESFVF